MINEQKTTKKGIFKSKSSKSILSLFLLLTIIGGLIFGLSNTALIFFHPSDMRMKSYLKNHKAEFEKLVQMVNEDKNLSFVDEKRASMERNTPMIPQERLTEYRTLMNQVGVLNLYAERELYGGVTSIRFLSSTAERDFLFSYQSTKSFTWVANTNEPYYRDAWLDFVSLPIPDLSSTDGYDSNDKTLVNPIENHWYLELRMVACNQCLHGYGE